MPTDTELDAALTALGCYGDSATRRVHEVVRLLAAQVRELWAAMPSPEVTASPVFYCGAQHQLLGGGICGCTLNRGHAGPHTAPGVATWPVAIPIATATPATETRERCVDSACDAHGPKRSVGDYHVVPAFSVGDKVREYFFDENGEINNRSLGVVMEVTRVDGSEYGVACRWPADEGSYPGGYRDAWFRACDLERVAKPTSTQSCHNCIDLPSGAVACPAHFGATPPAPTPECRDGGDATKTAIRERFYERVAKAGDPGTSILVGGSPCRDGGDGADCDVAALVARVKACAKAKLDPSPADATALCDAYESEKHKRECVETKRDKYRASYEDARRERDAVVVKLVEAERDRDDLREKLAAVERDRMRPIPMLLWCPECGGRHIDVDEFATKLHHTHSCQHCGLTWRPAIAPTCGVQFLPGFKNPTPVPS